MLFLRILLFPLSLLYGIITLFRNKLYDAGIFKVTNFNIPLISVGNLTTGGTGKTPHIEYLIRLLKTNYSLATLSRGYGRTSKGFIIVSETATSSEVGDEPLQFKRKFKDIVVAVENRRVKGVRELLHISKKLNVVLLDDAFQHRAIKAGLSLLLTEYEKPFNKDYLLPSGTLREFSSGFKRADIIIVTKTPRMFSPLERKRMMNEINPLEHQKIYFSYINYGNFVPLMPGKENNILSKEYYFERDYKILLLTGIANTNSLEGYLKERVQDVHTIKYSDHHEYTITELLNLQKTVDNMPSKNKIILTTEKDAMRLIKPELMEVLKKIPLFYVPIEIEFHDKDKENFDKQIINYVRSNQNIN